MHKKTVIDYYGGPSAVAKALGITPASVSMWPDLIPKGRAYELERLTNGELKANPDLYIKHQEALA